MYYPLGISIPRFRREEDGLVVYEFEFDDRVHKKRWTADFSYAELLYFYQTMLDYKLKKHLIEFPRKPFWKFWLNVEADDLLTEERRERLEEFFQHILTNKYTKTHKLTINFVKIGHQRINEKDIPKIVEVSAPNSPMSPKSPKTPLSARYSPPLVSSKSMNYLSPRLSPYIPIARSKSMHAPITTEKAHRKLSYAALRANSFVGSKLFRKYSLKPQF